MKGGRFVNVFPVLRFFYSLAWRYRKSYFLLMAGNMVLRGFSPFINIVMPKFIIDELLGQKRPGVVAGLVAALIGANFLLYLINNLRDYLMTRAHTFLELKFDELLGRKAMEMDFEYTENPAVLAQIEKAKTGMSWYSGGIAGLSENLTSIIAGLITLSGTLYLLGRFSPWLIAVMLGTMAVNMLIMAEYQQMNVQFTKELVGINRKFTYYFGLLKDFKYGKDIRLYDAVGLLTKRIEEYIDETFNKTLGKLIPMGTRFHTFMAFFSALQQATLYGYLGLRVLTRAIGIGDFQMLVSAAGSFTGSLSGILNQVIELGKNADFMKEYKIFMEYPPVKVSGREKPARKPEHILELRGVSFKYPGSDIFVLKNVSLTIPAGQKLAVVGPNGAGKTTFVKLLTRLYDPTEGEILLDGKDIRQYDPEEYQKLFAVVFQDYKLFAFDIRDNVTAGATYNEDAVKEALNKVGLGEKIESLPKGLATPVYRIFDQEGVEFSGGEGQKLAIARAIYKDSPIVILDEPTAALDPLAEYEVYQSFDRLIGGKTAIYISHRLASCRFCDKIAVFDAGRIVEYGDHGELCARGGLYAEMWKTQAEWYISPHKTAAS